MSRTKMAIRTDALTLAVGLLLAATPASAQDQGTHGSFLLTRYPVPAGQLRPCSCFGYYPTRWTPWEAACPVLSEAPRPSSSPAGPVPPTPPTPVTPPATVPVPPPAAPTTPATAPSAAAPPAPPITTPRPAAPMPLQISQAIYVPPPPPSPPPAPGVMPAAYWSLAPMARSKPEATWASPAQPPAAKPENPSELVALPGGTPPPPPPPPPAVLRPLPPGLAP